MDKAFESRYKRLLILVDMAALAVSYALALYFRFQWRFVHNWQGPLYLMLVISELMLCALLDIYLGYSRSYKALVKLDPFQNFIVVVQNQVIIGAALLVILMVTQNTFFMSRLAFGYILILNIIVTYVFRMFYRAVIPGIRTPLVKVKPIVAAAHKESMGLVRDRLERTLPKDLKLAGCYELDTPNGLCSYVRSLTEVDDVLLYIAENDPQREEYLTALERGHINVYIASPVEGLDLTGSQSRVVGYYRAAYFSALTLRHAVLGVKFVVSRLDSAVLHVLRHIKELAGGYICFGNVHTTVTASEDPEYLMIQNGARFTFPDGTPICRNIQKAGYADAERIAGPDFMGAMFRMTMDGRTSHFFYGSTQETLDLLQKRLTQDYPGINIAGMYSPPFRELTEEEEKEVVEMIRTSGADLIWVGLGAPKQERWMAAHKDMFDGVMLGVGAGFNFYAGNIKRAPVWVQRMGMEWLYRLCQDPKRLFSRYFVTNIKFLLKVGL